MSFKILWQWEPHKHSGNIKKKKEASSPHFTRCQNGFMVLGISFLTVLNDCSAIRVVY